MSETRPAPADVPTTGRKTRSGGRSIAAPLVLGLAVVVLAALLVFILQNSQLVEVHYLGANTSIHFGLALLLSAAAGIVLAALIALVLRIRRSVRSRG